MVRPSETSNSTRQFSDFGAVALAYHRIGKPAIPLCPPDHKGVPVAHLAKCSNPGKTPLIEGWPRYGQTLPSLKDIQSWVKSWPNANSGGPTGPLWGIALDIDPRHGGDQEMQARGWEPPDTPTSLTGGGGLHYLFSHPGFHVPNKVAIAPGIDLRGDGGQIVLPPSLHASGKQYVWKPSLRIDETPTASPPDWLLRFIEETPLKPIAAWDGSGLDSAVQGVPLGERDSTGYRLACRWLAKGFSPAEVEHFLLAWSTTCHPPLGSAPGDPTPEVWAAAKVASAQKFLSTHPRRTTKRRRLHRAKAITDWEVRG